LAGAHHALPGGRQGDRRDPEARRLRSLGGLLLDRLEGAVLRAKLERQSGPLRVFAEMFQASLRS